MVLGLLWGSFATVLAARIPDGESVISGRSHCPSCGSMVRWYHNVPVFAWVALRGKCADCGSRISVRYPLIELAVGAAFLGVYLSFGLSVEALAFAYLAVICTALWAIDVAVHRLPNVLVLPAYPVLGGLLTVAALTGGSPGDLARAGAGLAILGGAYGILWLVYPVGLGFGDVKLAGVLGMVAGYLGWAELAVAGIAGPMVGGVVVAIGLATRKITRKSRVPYGPALIAGAWIGIFFGSPISDIYLKNLS